MKPSGKGLFYIAYAAALTGVTFSGWAEVKSNPYQPIVERNAFGLRPPPPPGSDAPPPPPPAPLAKVTLTGITSMFGPSSKRALLEIIEQEPGKPATPRKPILREGERDGSVEVLAINVEKNQVTIRNGTVETNITFEVQKTAATGPAPGVPPALPAGTVLNTFSAPGNPTAVHTSTGQPATAGPTIIGRDGGVNPGAGSGVTVFGANPTMAPAPGAVPLPGGALPGATTTPAGNTTTYGATPVGPAQGGLRIPPRQVRNPQDPTIKSIPPLPGNP